jgi:hypothetical protein
MENLENPVSAARGVFLWHHGKLIFQENYSWTHPTLNTIHPVTRLRIRV